MANKNISKLLKRRLPAGVLRTLTRLGRLADEYGVSAYLVGGCVRDLLLGVKNLDLDIVVEGQAIKFAQFLQTKKDLDLIKHQRFGTAALKLANGFKIDLASARKECYSSPAVLPQVSPSNIQEDLRRRDFSINALAAKINRDQFGKLFDFFAGARVLAQGEIRILHEQSFIDDPTRILRAIRFEQRLNFKIEAQTFKLMRKAIALGLLKNLSRFRLGREFILFLKEERWLKVVMRFDRLCGLKLIHPALKLDRAMLNRLKRVQGQGDWLVFFSLLTKELDNGQLEKLCCDFCLSKKDKQKLHCLRIKELK